MPGDRDPKLRLSSGSKPSLKKHTNDANSKVHAKTAAAVKAALEAETGLKVDETYNENLDTLMDHDDTPHRTDRSKTSDVTSKINNGKDDIPVRNHTRRKETFEPVDTDVRHVIMRSADKSNLHILNNIDPHTLGDELEILVNDYTSCRPLPSGGLLIHVDTLEKINILLSIEVFYTHDVEVELATLVGTVRGVIFDRRYTHKSEEYLEDKLYNEKVVKVRQILKDGQKTPLFILTFKTDRLPKNIRLKHEWKEVRPYRIRAQQCKKCYRFGHWSDACTRQQVCSNCGEEGKHIDTSCPQSTSKCCLCGNPHKATDDKLCPKWQK